MKCCFHFSFSLSKILSMSFQPTEISIWHIACSNGPLLHHPWGWVAHWHNFLPNHLSVISYCAERIVSWNGQHDPAGQGQWPLFSIPAKSFPRCMFGANLVIPAQICDKLLCEQGELHRQGEVHRQTVRQAIRQMQATTIPLWPERTVGKNKAKKKLVQIVFHSYRSWCVCFKMAVLVSNVGSVASNLDLKLTKTANC